jgi:hypothetical protein
VEGCVTTLVLARLPSDLEPLPLLHLAVVPSFLFLDHRCHQRNTVLLGDLIDHCHQWLIRWQDYSAVQLVAFRL